MSLMMFGCEDVLLETLDRAGYSSRIMKVNSQLGYSMAQSVSSRPLTTEVRFQARLSPFGICGRKVALGQILSELFAFPCEYHTTVALHSYIYHLGVTNRHINGRSSKT
jgi:hypothetical protein